MPKIQGRIDPETPIPSYTFSQAKAMGGIFSVRNLHTKFIFAENGYVIRVYINSPNFDVLHPAEAAETFRTTSFQLFEGDLTLSNVKGHQCP